MAMYCYSTDKELFQGDFATREEALAEGLDDGEGVTVWTGESVPIRCGDLLTPYAVENLLESIVDMAFEACGEEVTDDFLKGPDFPAKYRKGTPERAKAEERTAAHKKALEDLRERIGAAVDAWADDHGEQPKFWRVRDVREHAGEVT